MKNLPARGLIIVGLTITTTILAVFLGFFALEAPTMERLYRDYTFYFIGLAALLFLQKAVETALGRRSELKRWIGDNYPALLLALALVVAIGLAIPAEFRILADETNLLGMAMAMFDHHQCYNPTQVMFYFHGMSRTIESVVDMRPGFYPFHVYIAHSILGYDAANGFVVNLLAGFLVFVLLYALIEPWLGKPTACLAMLCLAAFPLLVMYFRSAGFETVNLLWLLLLVFCFHIFLAKPEAARAELLFLALPLLAQTRYESVLAVFCVVPLVLYLLPRAEFARLSWRTPILPALFLPVAWLRILTFNSKSFQVSAVNQAFGFDLLLNNLRKALLFFVGQKPQYGMVSLLGLLALAGLLKLAFDIFLKDGRLEPAKAIKEKASLVSGEKPDAKSTGFYPMLFLVASLTLTHALARFFYYWGDLTLQYTSRLGIVFLPVMALLTAYFCAALIKTGWFRWHWFFIAVLAIMLHGWPVAASNLAVRDIFFYREFKSVHDFLERNYPNKRDYFIISDLANLYVPFRYSAIYTGYAVANPNEVKAQLDQRTYSFALVVQKINRGNSEPVPASELGKRFPLKTLYETQLNAAEFIRISRIDSILDNYFDVEEMRGLSIPRPVTED
jgi:hypothetical protein